MVLLLASVTFAQQPPRDAMAKALEQQRATAAQQRQAVMKQAESMGVRLTPMAADSTLTAAPPTASPPAGSVPATSPTATDSGCEPMAEQAAAALIESTAKAQNLQPQLLRAMIEQESGFRPCAISPKGAKGLMQLMPDTAQDLGVTDPFDPQQNVDAGARYIRQLMTKYDGDVKRALGAYNAGPTTVDQAGGIPDIAETRQYVDAIMKKVEAVKPVSK